MQLRAYLLVCLIAAAAQAARANGGGYVRGGVERVGDIAGFEPLATENIRILDEKLTVMLGQSEADVEIRYLMRNETQKKVMVRFGFPVEESFDEDFMGKASSPQAVPRYCRDYTVSAAGKPLAAKWQVENNETKDPQFRGLAGWLVSEMTFAPGEEKPVRIHFKSSYPAESQWVSDDGVNYASIFKYRLSTAACWAGTIARGRVVLRPAGIDPRELKVLKPVNRFKKECNDWVWNFEDLEPTLADDLEIETQPRIRTFSPADENSGGYYAQRGERWTMVHANYQVVVSSTLQPEGEIRYDAESLKSDGVWSEGAPGPGIGEWLELTPVVPKPLAAISLAPGYGSDLELYHANARPKKILVELNGEHRFKVDVPDSPDDFRIPVEAYVKPVKTIRLTFEEVWEGKRFEDLCIREVRLHVHLDKKPKIRQSR